MELKNHPEFELREDAAIAFNAYEDAHGIRTVNSAKRYEHEQQELIDRWDKGGTYNRPPYLYPPARPARASLHVANGGIAVDVADWRVFKKHAHLFGFEWYGSSDPVHFTFTGWTPPTPTITTGDNEMALFILERTNSQVTKSVYDPIKGRAGRAISRDENTSFRKGQASGAVVYVTVSDAEYKRRGGKY